MEIGKIIGDTAQMVLTNACLGFWGLSPIFTGEGKNVHFGQHFGQGSELAAYSSTTGRNMAIQNHKC